MNRSSHTPAEGVLLTHASGEWSQIEIDNLIGCLSPMALVKRVARQPRMIVVSGQREKAALAGALGHDTFDVAPWNEEAQKTLDT